MAFIIYPDLLGQIKDKELKILTEDSSGRDHELQISYNAAKLEISSYLSHRYDMASSLIDVWIYDPSTERQEGEHVLAFAEDWAGDVAYVLGDLREYNGFLYLAKGDIPVNTEVEDTTLWVIVGISGQWYKSSEDDNDSALNTVGKWKIVPDPRNALLVQQAVNITLYDLHSRIKPRQIPEHRVQRRDDAIKHLTKAADPRKNITLNLPLVDHGEKSGVDMTWDSNDKQTHSY